MKVILVGYSKTGTKTMASAFRMLGLNTYDSMENYFYAYKGWYKIFDGEATAEDIQMMFNGVDALTDTPVFHYWKDLITAFPDAKVVLTLRDEDAWYKSFLHQIKTLNESHALWYLTIFSSASWPRWKYQKHTNDLIGHMVMFPRPWLTPMHERIMRAHYRFHNEDVLKNVPKDKLLVYKVQEGWGPLCEFLNIEIPDQVFPHENKASGIVKEFAQTSEIVAILFRKAIVPFSLFAITTSFVGYKLFWSSATIMVCDIIAEKCTKLWNNCNI